MASPYSGPTISFSPYRLKRSCTNAGSTSQKNSWLRSMQNHETHEGSSSEEPSSDDDSSAPSSIVFAAGEGGAAVR